MVFLVIDHIESADHVALKKHSGSKVLYRMVSNKIKYMRPSTTSNVHTHIHTPTATIGETSLSFHITVIHLFFDIFITS